MIKFMFRKFKMLGKNRYKLTIFNCVYCWDFKWYGRIYRPELGLASLDHIRITKKSKKGGRQ